ncbi:MAG: transporter substrate-binding domain-containing protein [Duganella sp.]
MPVLCPRLLRFVLTALCTGSGIGTLASAHAGSGELVMVAPLDQVMPIVRFQQGKLTGGMLRDVGDALAQRLGRRPLYVNAEPAKVTEVLAGGRADLMCYVMPGWIDGDYAWSVPVLPDIEMVAARPGAPHLRSLKDLRDKPVGTVAGYRYPRVQQVLGQRFRRVDAESMEANLRRAVEGKTDYIIISEATLAYLQRNASGVQLRPELVFAAFKTQCALSHKSRVPHAEINQALEAMVKDGAIDQILARYR